MHAIETTGIIDCEGHLQVRHPLPAPEGEVKIIVLFDDKPTAQKVAKPRKSFHEAVGLYYRLNPDAPRVTTAEVMEELRGGEYED